MSSGNVLANGVARSFQLKSGERIISIAGMWGRISGEGLLLHEVQWWFLGTGVHCVAAVGGSWSTSVSAGAGRCLVMVAMVILLSVGWGRVMWRSFP